MDILVPSPSHETSRTGLMNQVLIEVISLASSHLLTLSTVGTSLKFATLTQDHPNTELVGVRIKLSHLGIGNTVAVE
jgi:hypothetical protein